MLKVGSAGAPELSWWLGRTRMTWSIAGWSVWRSGWGRAHWTLSGPRSGRSLSLKISNQREINKLVIASNLRWIPNSVARVQRLWDIYRWNFSWNDRSHGIPKTFADWVWNSPWKVVLSNQRLWSNGLPSVSTSMRWSCFWKPSKMQTAVKSSRATFNLSTTSLDGGSSDFLSFSENESV